MRSARRTDDPREKDHLHFSRDAYVMVKDSPYAETRIADIRCGTHRPLRPEGIFPFDKIWDFFQTPEVIVSRKENCMARIF
jgi:hypothetical protein